MKCDFFSFQCIVNALNNYWSSLGCEILNICSNEVGAGTLHPATFFASIDNRSHKIAYMQPVTRPDDGRYGQHPNRLYQHHQYQVLLKPSPTQIQDMYLDSLSHIGINFQDHDIRFVEDDWENPSIGASGLGWEIWCDGMEISQFTYMQQVGSVECQSIPGELAYGLERIAMQIQNVNSIYDIVWDKNGTKYSKIFLEREKQFSEYALKLANQEFLFKQFIGFESECDNAIKNNIPIVAYDFCIKSNHVLNLLDATGAIGPIERASYIARVRELARSCVEIYKKNYE